MVYSQQQQQQQQQQKSMILRSSKMNISSHENIADDDNHHSNQCKYKSSSSSSITTTAKRQIKNTNDTVKNLKHRPLSGTMSNAYYSKVRKYPQNVHTILILGMILLFFQICHNNRNNCCHCFEISLQSQQQRLLLFGAGTVGRKLVPLIKPLRYHQSASSSSSALLLLSLQQQHQRLHDVVTRKSRINYNKSNRQYLQRSLKATTTKTTTKTTITTIESRETAPAAAERTTALYQTAATSENGEKNTDDVLDKIKSNENEKVATSSTTKEYINTLKRSRFNEFVQIAIPALIQLAAEPLAGLVDTAYLGRLGPAVLGGAGVAISAQYAVGKLYNDPLLRTSISLVAAQDGKKKNKREEQQEQEQQQEQEKFNDNSKATESVVIANEDEKDLSVAVSTALLLALTVGVVQMIVYGIFCTSITRAMGLEPTNEMWYSCISYLQIRALGTPAATLWLVTNGIFRGLRDTRTPLLYSLFFTILNAILDPIFIFGFHFGAAGAAAGTAIAQYIALIPLMLALNRKVPIQIRSQWKQLGPSLVQYVQAGGLVLFRSIGKVMAYSVCARHAAMLGSVAAAAYNLTFQLGFATTQICEAVAVAVQTLLARELAAAAGAVEVSATTTTTTETEPSNHATTTSRTVTNTLTPAIRTELIRYLINTSVWMGGTIATILSIVTYWRRNWIVQGLSTNINVQRLCIEIFPIVLVTQVLKGLAYPVNGILMGGLDWTYSMLTMWLANIVCIGLIQYWVYTATTSAAGAVVVVANSSASVLTLQQLWIALAAFMGTQVIAGIVRYESKQGIWKVLQRRRPQPDTATILIT